MMTKKFPPKLRLQEKKEKDRRYLWNHGICPPLKNVRRKRFRKVLQKKYQEQPDIEKEVKRLFKADNEAMDIKWEVVFEDDKTGGHDRASLNRQDDNDDSMPTQSKNRLGLGAVDIFGDVSSSDEDDENDGSAATHAEDAQPLHVKAQHPADDFESRDDTLDSELSNMKNDLQDLGHQLNDLIETRIRHEMELSMIIDNSDLKDKLQNELDNVIEEENRKRHDFEILSSVLNQ